ncbi:hypothetical protein [Neorhizobium sp. NCHU2750]|uniref:hypothetical protein n=1 Tax=Neorhizobium sp. NCHU2750 TaxID=1825976 RepID=UPI000E70F592|nr:hypothetical protein NCHU2750_33840 [Neorhizobium sp. NCHU2750]
MGYRIGTLHARDVLRAYALIERIMPGLDLDQWTALTRRAADCRRWFVVKDREGYIRGICHVAVRGEGDFRRQVEVPLIAAVSLKDCEEVRALLFSAVKTFAMAERCQKIHIWTAVPTTWPVLVDYLDHGPRGHGLIISADSDSLPDQPIFPVKM